VAFAALVTLITAPARVAARIAVVDNDHNWLIDNHEVAEDNHRAVELETEW
jgi:hypothetical protein